MTVVVDNRELDAAIAERAESTNIPRLLLEEGRTVVVLDEDGETVELRPDGSRQKLARP